MYYNIFESTVQVVEDNKWVTIKFPGGFYTLETAAQKLNNLLNERGHNVTTENLRLIIEGPNERNNLRLSPYLASVFKMDRKVRKKSVSRDAIYLDLYCMYVTTDVIKAQMFNDTSLRVLAAIDPKESKIMNPIFLPTSTDPIETLEIQMIDFSGRHVQFISSYPKFVLCLRNA